MPGGDERMHPEIYPFLHSFDPLGQRHLVVKSLLAFPLDTAGLDTLLASQSC